jgi:hypothetical protein
MTCTNVLGSLVSFAAASAASVSHFCFYHHEQLAHVFFYHKDKDVSTCNTPKNDFIPS